MIKMTWRNNTPAQNSSKHGEIKQLKAELVLNRKELYAEISMEGQEQNPRVELPKDLSHWWCTKRNSFWGDKSTVEGLKFMYKFCLKMYLNLKHLVSLRNKVFVFLSFQIQQFLVIFNVSKYMEVTRRKNKF